MGLGHGVTELDYLETPYGKRVSVPNIVGLSKAANKFTVKIQIRIGGDGAVCFDI